MQHVINDLTAIKDLLTRVVVVEERISNSNEATGRAFVEINKINAIVDQLKRDADRHVGWAKGIILASGVIAALFGWIIKTNIDPLIGIPDKLQQLADAEITTRAALQSHLRQDKGTSVEEQSLEQSRLPHANR